MNPVARTLIALGAALIVAGLLWQLGASLGGRGLPFGRLPGDIVIDRPGFKFYFPLATSILVSIVLSLILYLFRR